MSCCCSSLIRHSRSPFARSRAAIRRHSNQARVGVQWHANRVTSSSSIAIRRQFDYAKESKGGIWTFDDLKSPPIPGLTRRTRKWLMRGETTRSRMIPSRRRQNESFETRYCTTRVPAGVVRAYMAQELSRGCRRPRPCHLKRRKRRGCSGSALLLEGNLDR
jgi:hypothetical protein